MKSIVTLYYKSLVNKEKNFVLDNSDGSKSIETYLATLTSQTIEDFQYIKQALSVSIKINLNQEKLEMVDANDINYVSIQNIDEDETPLKKYYYFVIAKNWKSKETIEFVLSMDTLNTFKFNTDYKLTEKTLIKRVHKNRFSVSVTTFFISKAEIPLFLPPFKNAEFDVENMYITGDENKNILNVKGIYRDGTGVPVNRRGLYLYGFNEEDSKWIYQHRNSNRYAVDSLTWGGDEHELDTPQSLINININGTFIKKIDLKSEEISAPLYKNKETTLIENDLNINWSLYYKNSSNQETSPIDCYLVPGVEIKAQVPQTASLTANMIPNGKTILIFRPYNDEYIIFDFGTIRIAPQDRTDFALAFRNDNGRLVAWYYFGAWYVVGDNIQTCNIINANGSFNCRIEDYLPDIPTINRNHMWEPGWVNYNIETQPSVVETISGKQSIDKTLAENLKIINIPYCASSYKSTLIDNEEVISFDGYWNYESQTNRLKLNDFNQKFVNNITSNADDILKDYISTLSINTTSKRHVIDSKLFHSDYYQIKFVYDSFSYTFYLEQIDYYETSKIHSTDKFSFQFIMSRNIVSKFLFKFDFVYKYSTLDYENIVAVARNNEEVLYNSQYLNYVRTGFNYDLKAKEKQDVAGGVGLGLNIAGLLASIGLSFVPGGQAVGIAGIVGSTIGLTNQIVNYAKTTSQSEENLQRKIEESQRQAVSVLNADDYDLMDAYCSNRAKLCYYKISPNMEKILDDLFYYCGYIDNQQGIPNISSRYWFNFVQSTLIIEDSSNLTSDIEDDIKEKFEQGVTFLHYHSDSTIKFDFKQEMENWENDIL